MDAVFFDLDDTIYKQSLPFVRTYEELYGSDPAIQALGIDPEELYKASRRHSDALFGPMTRGELSQEDMEALRVMRAFEDFGATVSREDALRFQKVYANHEEHEISLSPTMQQVLDLVAARSNAGIITNGPYEHQLRKIRTLGLNDWMPSERILVSGGLDVAKPDPEIFLMGCRTVQSSPERCLYVGDNFKYDVVGPASAGMPCVWFNHRHRERPAEPVPTWTVDSEQGLLDLLAELL